MKLFLKPTAIFACIALLFCACGDDETEDLSYTLAPVTLADPVDVTVASGNGRAAVTWRVPDDGSITHAMIQWDNADETAGVTANLNEITRVKVVPSVKETYYIGEVGDLLSRNHNFKVTHIRVNSKGTITDRSKTVEVNSFFIYNNSTYANSMPNPYSISTSGTSTANISWSRFDEDLYSVKLSYTNTSGVTIDKTDDFFINEDEPTITLDDVKMDTPFKFYAYFKPKGGLDIVEILSSSELDMASSAASPTSVSVLPGLGRMRVRWMIPTNESIVSSIVKYKRVADNSGNPVNSAELQVQYGGDKISGVNYYYDEDVLINNRNERYISGDATTPSGNSDDTSGGLWASIRPLTYLTSGYYEVSVINVKANGKFSTAVEEDGTLQTIHVYGYDSFVHATLSGVPIRNAAGVVKFDFIENLTWNNATSVCTGITLNYTDSDGNGQSKTADLEYFSETGLTDTKVATTFTYETHFSPGLDDLTLSATAVGDNSFIPDVAPNSPKAITAKAGVAEVSDTGNFENQTPVIHVTWTPDDDAVADKITNYRIYWYAVSGEVYKTEYLSIDELDVTADGEYTYTLTENLETDTKYYVEVVSASEELDGIDGRTESEKIAVFDRPVTYSYETYKDVALAWGAVKNNGFTASVVWSSIPSECVGVAVFYNKANTPNTRYPESGYSELSATISSTPLESAIVGEPFKYLVYHKPTSGVEPVKVWSTDSQSGVIPEPVPVPTISSTTTGYTEGEDEENPGVIIYESYINVNWTQLIDIDKVVDRMYVRYAPQGGESTDIRLSLAATSYKLTTADHGLTAGTTYNIQIVTEDDDEQDFVGANLTSESSVSAVVAYDALSYSAANLPIATAFIEGSVNFTWTNVHNDLKSLTLKYGTQTKTCTRDDLVDGFSLPYESSADQKFTYEAIFAPTGGESDIAVTGGTGMALFEPGSSLDYYVNGTTWEIYTAKGLKEFATQVNNSSSARGLGAKLMNDIDMSTVCGPAESVGSWTPIGVSTTAAYTGTFDGNNKKIVGLYINAISQNQGLFGCISGATIKNVILEDPKITTTASYMGGIASNVAAASVIDGCRVQGDYGYLRSSVATADANVGGIASVVSGSTLINCYNDVNIQSTSGSGRVMGGIAARINSLASQIIGCYNAGDVTAMSDAGAVGGYNAAGIVSYVTAGTSKIVGCTNAGVITANCYVGVITGWIAQTADVVGCYVTPEGGLNTYGGMCGGIMGRFNEVVINIVGCCNAGFIYNPMKENVSYFVGACSSTNTYPDAVKTDSYTYLNQNIFMSGCAYLPATTGAPEVQPTTGTYQYIDCSFATNPTRGTVTDGIVDWTEAYQTVEGVVTRVTSISLLNNQVETMNAAIVKSGIPAAMGYSCEFSKGALVMTDLPTVKVTAL